MNVDRSVYVAGNGKMLKLQKQKTFTLNEPEISMHKTVCIFAIFLVSLFTAPVFSQVSTLSRAHAHNDYWHTRPCLDALDQGFTSVEADVFLVEGEILVGHDREECRKEKTLESLYFIPLQKRTEQFNGSIYPDSCPFYLWIDLKTDGNEMFPVLQKLFKKYDSILTHYDEQGKRTLKAITIILTGKKSVELILKEKGRRYTTVDGEAEELNSDLPATILSCINMKWDRQFPLSDPKDPLSFDRNKLQDQVKKAHEKGRTVRYWGAPDQEGIWKAQYDAGVDFINSDRLKELRHFLINR